MELLQSRFGNDFMTACTATTPMAWSVSRRPSTGLRTSERAGSPGKVVAADVLHDWSLAVALDGLVDAATASGRRRRRT